MECSQAPARAFAHPIQMECIPLTVSFDLYFFRHSQVFCMLHHCSQDEFTIRNAILYFHVLSWHFFFVVLFHYKIFAFIVFIPFVDNVSNFRNKMLTNQKLDLMARQCQSDWMYALVIALSEYNMTLISYEFLRFCRPNWRLVTTKCWPYCTTSAWYN